MRKLIRLFGGFVAFTLYFWLLFRLFLENTKEGLCRLFTKDCEHKWEPTPTLERKRTLTYARCRRCGAQR